MARTRKDGFRSDVRRALSLLRLRVDPHETGLDEDEVNSLLQNAALWITSKVVEDYDPADWKNLSGNRRAELAEHVAQFKVLAARANPRDEITGYVNSLPVIARDRNRARNCLLRIAALIGADHESYLKLKRRGILAIAKKHGARNIRLFGSVARGKAGPESDIDLLVDFEPERTLLDHVGLIQDLQKLLGCKVDVVTEGALHWHIRKRVQKDAIAL